MSATTTHAKATDLQLATFYVGDLLLALPIDYVQEINRNLELTEIPDAPEHVRGVINLRGDVATVLDLRRVLGFSAGGSDTAKPQLGRFAPATNRLGYGSIALPTSFRCLATKLVLLPANISGTDGRFFKGVHRTDNDIVVLLDAGEVLSVE